MLWERASWLPPRLIAPTVGLKPKQPQKLDGRTIEPNTCVPMPTLIAPTATAAAEPLLEPPGVRVRSHGLRVARGCIHANSVVTVLPTITAPASRSAATLAASRSLRKPANSGEPFSVGMSMVSMMSLIPIGMPSIGESGLPARQRSVERSAAVLRGGKIERDEGADLRLPGVEVGDAALEKFARRVFAAGEIRRRRKKRLHPGLNRVGRVHGFASVALHCVQARCLAAARSAVHASRE